MIINGKSLFSYIDVSVVAIIAICWVPLHGVMVRLTDYFSEFDSY